MSEQPGNPAPVEASPAEGQRAEVAAPPSAETGKAPPSDPKLVQLEAELAKAREDLAARDKRIDEVTRAYSSLVNDHKEMRGRMEREKERVLENERGKVALQLMELGDELDRALSASAADTGPLARGVRLVREGLHRRLSAMGIERLKVVGEPFDPMVAEAVDLVAVPETEKDGVVVDEATAGYRQGDRLLRPARVRVARHVAPKAPAAEAPAEQKSPAGTPTH